MQILDSMSDLDHIDESIKQHLLPTKETFCPNQHNFIYKYKGKRYTQFQIYNHLTKF
jgi:hypothetical protein